MKKNISFNCAHFILFLIAFSLTNNIYGTNVKYNNKVEKIVAEEDWISIDKHISKDIDQLIEVKLARSSTYITILMYAVLYDNIEIVDYLLKKGADPNIGVPLTNDEKSHYVEQKIMNVKFKETPLILALKLDKDKSPNKDKIINSLVSAGANPNSFDNKNQSALNYAVDNCREYVEILLKNGANLYYECPNSYNQKNEDVYDIIIRNAKFYGNLSETVDVLVKYNFETTGMIDAIMAYLIIEHKRYDQAYDSRYIKRSIQLITHLIKMNYDHINTDQFLTLVKYTLYTPGMVPSLYGDMPAKTNVEWFVELFNNVWKMNSEEMKGVMANNGYLNTVENAFQKSQGSPERIYKNFLIKLNSSIKDNDTEWLDSYGFQLN